MNGESAPSHDADSCPICGPFVRTDAYRRGVARALSTTVDKIEKEEAPE